MWLGALKSKLKWSEAEVKTEDEVGAEAKFEVLQPKAVEVSSIGDETLGFVNSNIDVSVAGVSSDGEETGGFVNLNIDMSAAGAEVSSDGEETLGFSNLNIDVSAAGAVVRFMNSNMELFNCWNSVWGVLDRVRSCLKLGKLTYVR